MQQAQRSFDARRSGPGAWRGGVNWAVVGCTLASVGAVLAVASMRNSPLHPLLADDQPSWLFGPGSTINGPSQGWLVPVAVLAVASAVAAWVFALRESWRERVMLSTAVVVAIGLAVIVLAVPVLFSRDAYNYALYGEIATEYGANPYTTTPSAYPEEPLTPLSGEKWREDASVYGPAFTLLSSGIAALTDSPVHAVLAFRFLAALASVGTTLLIAFAARDIMPRKASFAVVAFGWSPVVVFNATGGGHNDLLLSLAVSAALAFLVVRRVPLATVALTLGMLVKASLVVPLVLLVLWAVMRRSTLRERAGEAALHAAIVVGLTVGFALPWWTPQNPTLGLSQVAGNAGGFSPSALALRLLDAGGIGAPVTVLVRLLFVAGFLAAFWWVAAWLVRGAWAHRPRDLGAAWGWALLILLLAGPVLLPWYVVWVLPLAFLLPKAPRVVALGLAAVTALFQVVAEPLRSAAWYEGMHLVRDYGVRALVGAAFVWLLLDLWRRSRDAEPLAEGGQRVPGPTG